MEQNILFEIIDILLNKEIHTRALAKRLNINHMTTSRHLKELVNDNVLDFLLMLKKVFADRKYIELSDMAWLPLSEEHLCDYFQLDELKSIVDKCNAIKVCC